MSRVLGLFATFIRFGRGRPLALVFLTGFSFFLLFQTHSPLRMFKHGLFDVYQSTLPRERLSAPATIIGIDEESLRLFGQWPWPRTRLAALIDRLAAYQPAVTVLDIIMPEPDSASPARLAEILPGIDPDFKKRLAAMPDNDQVLAAAFSRTPTVIGAAGLYEPTATSSTTLRTAPFLTQGEHPGPFIKRYRAVLKSLPVLEQAAAGQALVSADLEKGVVRRLPLIAAVGETLVPSLSLEALRVAFGLPAIGVRVDSFGIDRLFLGDLIIPTQENGEVWVHFTPFLPERYVSAADLFKGRVNPDLIRQKIVLVGLTGLGLLDYHTTPLGERIPGIEVHAQILENIFEQRFLRRSGWVPAAELALFLACGFFFMVLAPYWKPRRSILFAVTVIGLMLLTGFGLYSFTRLLFDAATLSIGLGSVYACLLGSTLIEADREKRVLQQTLQLERESAARIAGELEAAQRIQMGSLPDPETVLGKEGRVELDALLEPARQVGGDLFDFYFIDEARLLVVIGDVSGKGLPASLFMIVTKVLIKSIALDGVSGVHEILNRANRELARENPEMLFVTIFAAILDLQEGWVQYVIAGHDAPWLITDSGKVSRLAGGGNLALSVFDDLEYRAERLQLAAGDVICMVTDGITEAMDRAGNLYGSDRLTELLRKMIPAIPVSQLIRTIRDDVRSFVGDAEQSDDLTLLVLRWKGPCQR